MATAQLESAIPAHLQQSRTQPWRMPTLQYEPAVPAYASRFSESIKDVVIAIFGAQHGKAPALPSQPLSRLVSFTQADTINHNKRPIHFQLSSGIDVAGAYNEVVIAYWKCKADYIAWSQQSGFELWWQNLNPKIESHGWFKEVFYPSADRLETVFSDNTTPEGVAYMHDKFSGPVREHVYWGSMRDRLPASQADELVGTKLKAEPGAKHDDATNGASSNSAEESESNPSRIRIPGKKNLAIIRSGQDWSATLPEERELYLTTMHPVLIRGMNFLIHEGDEVGCISNRFMSVVDPTTHSSKDIDKTFGLGYFYDLKSLEGWSKQHKTHLDIFGRFMQYAKELQGNVSLRLFHEVLVLEPEQQEFEYINCHSRTGMLAFR